MWKEVDDELPDDGILVLVWGLSDPMHGYTHGLATFCRSRGWRVSPDMDVFKWMDFEKCKDPRDELKEVEPEEPPNVDRRSAFNKWWNPGD